MVYYTLESGASFAACVELILNACNTVMHGLQMHGMETSMDSSTFQVLVDQVQEYMVIVVLQDVQMLLHVTITQMQQPMMDHVILLQKV